MFNYTIPKNCVNVKLDIGLSYSAPQSQYWLKKEDNLMVFGFEPNPDAYTCIKYNNVNLTNVNKFKGRFKIFKYALNNVEKPEEMKFYATEKDCGTSSLYEPIDNISKDRIGYYNILKVPVISLKMFFDEFPWNRFEYIDYIKIDAQGSDLNILKGAGDYLKDRVVFVTAEPDGFYYNGASECNVDNITNYMLSQNFVRINHSNTKDPTFLNTKYKNIANNIFISQF